MSIKKKVFVFMTVIVLLFSLISCSKKESEKEINISSDSLYVKKVDNIPEDFIFGMDASSVIAEENSGVRYFDYDGEECDVFKVLSISGINYIRVRVWNNPYDTEGNGYGGGNCDINTAVEIGKRATLYGMKLLVDFHYSDFWADPSKQMVPLEWKDYSIEEKTDALYKYTFDCLSMLKDSGIDVGMVQVGNETNGTLCGEKTWFNIQYLMQAGAKAVREVYPEALVAVHFANPEKASSYETYAKKLDYYDVDYDVFGSSYYPYWHGTLDNLVEVLNNISNTYGKKVMVLETSYAYTADDSDFNGNTISDGSNVTKNYPYTVEGQATSVRNIIDAVVNKMTDGIGICYWEGTWISVGQSTWEENSILWEKYGSGWASSYASVYDPNDAGKYYGGNAVENQAMFDKDGHPLESLKVFKLVKSGNEAEVVPDAIEDVNLIIDLNGEIILPDTVNAIMTDGRLEPIDVEWKISDKDYETMYTSGPQHYDIEGLAGNMTAHCYISMVEFNFLDNYSFEDGELGQWTVTETGNADELYVEKKSTDSLTGEWHMHFWSSAKNSVDFKLEQNVESLPQGNYKFTVSIMGGDAGETEIYAYIMVDGELVSRKEMNITSYGNWDTVTTDPAFVNDGQTVTVGISVKCEGAGNGAWGKIDDALLNSLSN